MKIVFYSPVSLRNGGGGEQWQMAIAPKLQTLFGHQVEIIACAYGAKNLSSATVRQRLHGVPYTELPIRTFVGSFLPAGSVRPLLRKKLLAADAVHYIFGFVGHDLMINHMVERERTRVFAGFHSPIYIHNHIHNLYIGSVSRYLVLPHCTGFFTFNNDQQAIMKSWNLTQPCVSIAGGVDTARFIPPVTARSTKTMGLLYVGRFEYEKGVDILCEAVDRWLTTSPNVQAHMTILGSGSYEGAVRQLSEKYPDHVTHALYAADTLPYYQRAHLLVVPSRQETFGFAMVEALATGIPVLASSADGPLQVLTEDTNGWLIGAVTVDSLARALNTRYEQWQRDPRAWLSFERPTRQAASLYSPEVIARRVHDAFESSGKRL